MSLLFFNNKKVKTLRANERRQTKKKKKLQVFKELFGPVFFQFVGVTPNPPATDLNPAVFYKKKIITVLFIRSRL